MFAAFFVWFSASTLRLRIAATALANGKVHSQFRSAWTEFLMKKPDFLKRLQEDTSCELHGLTQLVPKLKLLNCSFVLTRNRRPSRLPTRPSRHRDEVGACLKMTDSHRVVPCSRSVSNCMGPRRLSDNHFASIQCVKMIKKSPLPFNISRLKRTNKNKLDGN